MKKFIYVFNEKDKQKLIDAGFVILKEDVENDMYVFLNQPCLTFDLIEASFVKSDTLTF